MKQTLELLAPAGNLEIYKAAVGAGADAIYFGGTSFGARAYAKNFSFEEAKEAISYGKLFGVKSYLTINTLLKNTEIEKNLYEYLKYYYECGIDAVLVQDVGVLSFIQSYFPDLAIHASTQMTITNGTGAKFLHKQGVTRVVTAREMSLSEIAAMHAMCPEMEIETFCHGALCMCYSGQCLMSSLLGGRSGNRGRCAQPCRLPYALFDQDRQPVAMPGDYLLSLKDLCAISDLSALARAGVYSFKVEGRMKQRAYTTGVIKLYRNYLDAYLEGRDPTVSREDQTKLLMLGNRHGFTNAYFTKHNDPSMMTYQKPHHTNQTVEDEEMTEKKLAVDATFIAHAGEELKLQLSCQGYEVCVCGDVVESSINKPTNVDDIQKHLDKIKDTPYYLYRCTYDLSDAIFLPVSKINAIRREAFSRLYEEMSRIHRSPAIEQKPFDSIENPKNDAPDLYIFCKTVAQAEFVDAREEALFLILPVEEALLHPQKTWRHPLYLSFPKVMRNDAQDFIEQNRPWWSDDAICGIIAYSIDEIAYLQQVGYPKEKVIIAYYTYANAALSYFQTLGYQKFFCAEELNAKELFHRENKESILPIYGRQQMMTTANCQRKNAYGCEKKREWMYLQDRKGEFLPVFCNCTYCYNEIYNAKTLCLFDERKTISDLGVSGVLLSFLTETAEEIEAVLLYYHKKEGISGSTKGHFKRGVE